MLSFDQIVFHEILKEGIKPSIRRAYAVFGIGETDQTAEKLSEFKEDILEVRNKLQMIGATLKRIENKVDENRMAGLLRGFNLLHDATQMTNGKIAILEQSLVAFHDILGLPSAGKTAKWTNTELKAFASFGLAAAHHELGNSDELITSHLVKGFLSDPNIAKAFIVPSLFDKLSEIETKVKPKITFCFISSERFNGYISIYEDFDPDMPLCEQDRIATLFLDNQKNITKEMTIYPGHHNYTIIFCEDSELEIKEDISIVTERGNSYYIQIKHNFSKESVVTFLKIKEEFNLQFKSSDIKVGQSLSVDISVSEFISLEDIR